MENQAPPENPRREEASFLRPICQSLYICCVGIYEVGTNIVTHFVENNFCLGVNPLLGKESAFLL